MDHRTLTFFTQLRYSVVMRQTTKIGIYHKNCTDGTTSAAVLLRKFPNIKLFSVAHSIESIIETVEKIREIADADSEIYFVDITSGAEELLKDGYKITVIDHHIGLKEKIDKLAQENQNFTYIFDNDKSGASLAWAYFFPDEEVPKIIKYVEDSDLWKGEYDDTKYVVNYLSTNANTPEKILEFIENGGIEEIKEKGKIIADYSDVQIDRFIEDANTVDLRIGELIIPAYNLTSHEYASVVGNKLSILNNKATVMFSINGNFVKFSIRGNEGQSPTALDVAKLLGGGGHKNAAGAEIPLNDFLKMIII